MSDTNAPHALLFTAPGCPHCPGIKAALEKLHQEGVVGELEVVSIAEDQGRAAEMGVRSVPWLKLGEFVLTGAQTPQQLREWAEKAAGSADMVDYLEHQLANGELDEAQAMLAKAPQHLEALLSLLEQPEAKIQVRLGVSAIIEGMEGSEALQKLVPRLIIMSEHSDHQLRSDACHFLGLSHSKEAEAALRKRLEDDNEEVREIAAESLELIQQ
ncbi:MAG: HEAT repeat domain-containing protein [Gammaproteobacteria bacterium]|nr:HEAT repeat domain-containing protein [Gammaproteobacteria bacterium]MCW8839634.1 HEAT repeat domain-containing protein [Gammaproteobacteria bacterium]MCW8959032.1 HEAT repeat domain-containing protein [Gammaproteobacteria bacterium]MCW8973200.1 HEAT repeat domain-containing protein [Gammaproteobacteria bacterium]MCW8993945.1 HEAT repeat domain-containing protein [Gammaproteobacteria bacterium]